MCLLGAATAAYFLVDRNGSDTKAPSVGNGKEPPVPGPAPTPDRDREVAQWSVGLGAEVVVILLGTEERITVPPADLPGKPFRLTNVDFRRVRGPVTDAELNRLSGTSVVDLNVCNSNITDKGLEAISDLKLIFLAADDVRGITDIGAARLARVRGLQYLYLSRTRITDKGLGELGQLPKLLELHVKGTDVTLEGVKRFKAAMRGRKQECIVEDDWPGQN